MLMNSIQVSQKKKLVTRYVSGLYNYGHFVLVLSIRERKDVKKNCDIAIVEETGINITSCDNFLFTVKPGWSASTLHCD